ncbi:hypothetical protein [Salimicrobium halophilum]|uniref:Uncharacterized protein n=1 Tax=Salimicrobium halophilum TaxID=86666 RepID=A0A1G8R4T8_9BACI|nr:hypothetical protein [Salimicrobium halophilum]SDJ11948.1 hypothetical protein SAMN04490247_0823 [Salimicrobium halophilum]
MFKTKRRLWGSAFVITLLSLAAIYQFAFGGQYLDYGMTEEGQFVLKEGIGQGTPITNTDVRGEEEGLNRLGGYMNTFNMGIWVLILAVSLFAATFITLRNDHLMGKHPKRKRYLWWMWIGTALALAMFVVYWTRYIKLINEGIHSVLF